MFLVDAFASKRGRESLKITLQIVGAFLLLFTMFHANDVGRVLLVTLGALFLFTSEKLPVDLTAILIMSVLMVFGLVTPKEGVSGFSNSATITVMAMFVLSAGIQRTGIVHTIGRVVFRFAGNSEVRQMFAIALIVGPISGFINNTAAVAVMLPMILDLAKRAKISATKLLIPLSFFAMAGGTLTLIGTSTNILAASIFTESGLGKIGMFEFFHIGAIVLGAVFLFLLIFGRWLLPERKNLQDENDTWDSDFLVEVLVEKNSPLIGKTLQESKFIERHDANLVKVVRGETSFVKDAADKKIEENDVILMHAEQERVMDLDQNEKDGIKLLLNFDESKRRFPAGKGDIAKVLVRSVPIFHQKSLAQIDFWQKFGAAVVGVHRGDLTVQRLADLKLKTGEILLVKASRGVLQDLRRSNDFVVVETVQTEFNREKMWTALGVVTLVISLAAFGVLPIMVTALCGVILMILTGCLESEDLHKAVSWDVIFLLAGVIPLGIAMQNSGAADSLANFLAATGERFPPVVILFVFYVFTTLLTEIISNNASVVLIVPLAISVAQKLGIDPKPFVFAIMFAASTSFLTPIGYQTNTMVFGAGNYKFSDFIKIGAPLNILLAILTTFLIAKFFHFF